VPSSFSRTLLVVLIPCAFMGGCAQTKQYTPSPSATAYQLAGLPANIVDVQVNDLRPDAGADEAFKNVLRGQLLAALSSQVAHESANRYSLTVDIIEHRSFFTLGNWNASTRFRIRLKGAGSSILGQWDATGTARRSNMWGYVTAAAVSQDSYNIAVADLMSSLSQASVR